MHGFGDCRARVLRVFLLQIDFLRTRRTGTGYRRNVKVDRTHSFPLQPSLLFISLWSLCHLWRYLDSSTPHPVTLRQPFKSLAPTSILTVLSPRRHSHALLTNDFLLEGTKLVRPVVKVCRRQTRLSATCPPVSMPRRRLISMPPGLEIPKLVWQKLIPLICVTGLTTYRHTAKGQCSYRSPRLCRIVVLACSSIPKVLVETMASFQENPRGQARIPTYFLRTRTTQSDPRSDAQTAACLARSRTLRTGHGGHSDGFGKS